MPLNQPLSALEQHDEFIGRHIGPCATEIAAMLVARLLPTGSRRISTVMENG